MPAKTREEIVNLLSKNKHELKKKFRVQRLGLFGSYARGDQRGDSDVDILVEVDPSIGLEFVSLAERLEQLIGLPIEIVSHRAINPRKMKLIEPEIIYV